MQISSTKAAIAGIGVNGGTETAVYDYTGPSYTPGVTRMGPSDETCTHLHRSTRSAVEWRTRPSGTASARLTVCYRVLAPISGAVFTDATAAVHRPDRPASTEWP